ncbi:ABC transporter permease [Francisella halioticida]|uniref:ABC transporter permease n=1 Tax=Francisella halioticida TaxID=549298 RepID=A0ABN5AUC4_9GAMM|nr:ABC transporter permease [Francisella halioticida]ASG67549.1 ABC transporter permease [Francisella halioticida]BCD90052.1 ABC transporter permease [Francisella halioticida]
MDLKVDKDTIYFEGLLTLKQVKPKIIDKKIDKIKNNIKHLDISKIESLDTAGAYFVIRLANTLNLSKEQIIINNEKNKNLINIVIKNFPSQKDEELAKPNNVVFNSIYTLGKNTNNLLLEIKASIGFLGVVFFGYLTLIRKPYKSFFSIVLDITYDSTIKALSIVILLSLIVGLVLTYLPLGLMQQYGTQIFVVDMLGVSSFREFAPLFTAIIIAGRSGSSFTSEIGIMKVNEEIDALQTIGEDPMQRLVLPRITALVISLPVLTTIAMVANIAGGMIIMDLVAGISPLQFIERLFTHVSVNHFYIGLLKTPFFALVIAGIGCHQGISVKRDSQSVGKATTTSVVHSIFLIILVDAIFAVALNGVG